ncbi:glycosyltransferase [Tautonia marina]|uniref:glycosyltransferase n=1 Tax=Tautonia marina TaxID=2653855 RepID=UPI001260947B|nr:glycosyltransferase [Tautonia marina]
MTTTILHLTASTFFGGPERQMLGLADALPPGYATRFALFREGGRAEAFLERLRASRHAATVLEHDTPQFAAAIAELSKVIRADRVDLLCCHGYKAGLLGRMAARRVGVPVIAVSRGWTYESLKVNLYEGLDRLNLRGFDRVVCVSEAQARKVRRVGVPRRKIVVIPNAIDVSRFATPDPAARAELEALFPRPIHHLVGAAGRLSPEKGFDLLIDAAATVLRHAPDTGFVLCGEGGQRATLERRIADRGLQERFLLLGLRPDLDRLLPAFDLLAQSSWTEGMPNVLLEAGAAGVPVVATAAGGTAEIVVDGQTGWLVPTGDASALADRIGLTLGDTLRRTNLGRNARQQVRGRFDFVNQARAYVELVDRLTDHAQSRSEESHPVPPTEPVRA